MATSSPQLTFVPTIQLLQAQTLDESIMSCGVSGHIKGLKNIQGVCGLPAFSPTERTEMTPLCDSDFKKFTLVSSEMDGMSVIQVVPSSANAQPSELGNAESVCLQETQALEDGASSTMAMPDSSTESQPLTVITKQSEAAAESIPMLDVEAQTQNVEDTAVRFSIRKVATDCCESITTGMSNCISWVKANPKKTVLIALGVTSGIAVIAGSASYKSTSYKSTSYKSKCAELPKFNFGIAKDNNLSLSAGGKNLASIQQARMQSGLTVDASALCQNDESSSLEYSCGNQSGNITLDNALEAKREIEKNCPYPKAEGAFFERFDVTLNPTQETTPVSYFVDDLCNSNSTTDFTELRITEAREDAAVNLYVRADYRS